MSGAGAPDTAELDGTGLNVAVVAARWHAQVTDALLANAVTALEECGVDRVAVVRVPGAFELPVAAARLAGAGYDAVVCLGVVVRGGTPHFDYVCQAATSGCTDVAVRTGVPIGFGVLTCDTDAQAFERSGLPGSSENKGREAALAAVETVLALRRLDHRRREAVSSMEEGE